MISKLSKKASGLVFQIILVIAGVIIFAWIDPFHIMLPEKTKLRNTPIQVQSIREIGELVTAEYYGEVITSLKEITNEEIELETTEFSNILEELHHDFSSMLNELRKVDLPSNGKKIYEYFMEEYGFINENMLYETYVYYLDKQLPNQQNFKPRDLKNSLTEREKEILFKRLYKNNFNCYDKFLKITLNDLKDAFSELKEIQNKKKFKVRLVILGRGWVKAGFNLGSFSPNNFIYDEKRKSIHLIGLEPKILSRTINPWFIPEKGVEGFEFLVADRGARLDTASVRKVKQRCMEKLVDQAMKKNILEQAQENAAMHLKSFFSLLLNVEIQQLYFHSDYLSYSQKVLLYDDRIKDGEIIFLDSMLVTFFRNYKEEGMNVRLDSLFKKMGEKENEVMGQTISLNARSSVLYRIVKDKDIDGADINQLKSLNTITTADTVWHYDLLPENFFKPAGKIKAGSEYKNKLRESIDKDIARMYDDLNSMFISLEMEMKWENINDSILLNCDFSGHQYYLLKAGEKVMFRRF